MVGELSSHAVITAVEAAEPLWAGGVALVVSASLAYMAAGQEAARLSGQVMAGTGQEVPRIGWLFQSSSNLLNVVFSLSEYILPEAALRLLVCACWFDCACWVVNEDVDHEG